jgi:AraC family transcriptional activator of pobA
MPGMQPHRIKTISEYHRFMGLPRPEHPLISVINFESIKHLPDYKSISLVFDFYSISLKRDFNARMKYGQQEYDFDEGIMFFISPGQVFGIEVEKFGMVVTRPSRFSLEYAFGQIAKAI